MAKIFFFHKLLSVKPLIQPKPFLSFKIPYVIFFSNFPDISTKKLNATLLAITRTDDSCGWGVKYESSTVYLIMTLTRTDDSCGWGVKYESSTIYLTMTLTRTDDSCGWGVKYESSTKYLTMTLTRTDNGCGWGVKALEKIKEGSFVVQGC